MAVVSLLAGGMVGFFSAVFSLVALDVSWMLALGLWGGIGIAAGFGMMILASLPKRDTRQAVAVEHA